MGTIQARTHVQLALACLQSMIRVQHRLRFTMLGNWVTSALIMLQLLAPMGLPLATMSLRVGLDTPSTLDVSMNATASVKLWNDFNTFEQRLRHHTRPGFSIGFSHRVSCVHCAPFVCSRHVSHLLSAVLFLLPLIIAFPTNDGSNLIIRVYRIEY